MKRETMMMVEWVDSNSQQGWHDSSERAAPATVVSVGFLTYDGRVNDEQRDRYVTLSASIDEQEGAAKPLGDSISIPGFAIKTMTELTPKRGSGAKSANGAATASRTEPLPVLATEEPTDVEG